MSKKSRKRNKKILAALALAGGAAMMAKGRGTPAAANVDSGRGSGLRSTVDSVVAPIIKKVAPVMNKVTNRGRLTIDGRGPLEHGNFMRSNAPEVITPAARAYTGAGNMRGMKGGGIAKRGTGAAYKSGGRVKSMGIAKRGGGAAKR